METLENRLKREIRASLKYDRADKTDESDYDIAWSRSWYAGRISLLRELIEEWKYQAIYEQAKREMEEE